MVSLSVVVGATADVGVEEDRGFGSGVCGFIGAILEDGGDRLVGAGIEQQGTGTGHRHVPGHSA